MLRRECVQAVPKGQHRHSSDGEDRFVSAFWKRERIGHGAQAGEADRCGEYEPVLPEAASKRNGPEQHRYDKAHFMNDRLSKQASCRGKKPDQHCSCSTVDEAQPRNAHGNPIETAGRKMRLRHDEVTYRPAPCEIQYIIRTHFALSELHREA